MSTPKSASQPAVARNVVLLTRTKESLQEFTNKLRQCPSQCRDVQSLETNSLSQQSFQKIEQHSQWCRLIRMKATRCTRQQHNDSVTRNVEKKPL